MEKRYLDLLAATHKATASTNDAWKRVIDYAVKRCHTDRENGLSYVQAALDSAPSGLRSAVASAFRQLNINVSKLEKGQFKADGIRNTARQEAVFARLKANDVPDVVTLIDKLPKPHKPDTRVAEAIVQDTIDRTLGRLKKTHPDAAALFNDRVCGKERTVEVEKVVEKFSPNTICIGNAEDIMECTADEIAAAVAAIMAMRIPALKAA